MEDHTTASSDGNNDARRPHFELSAAVFTLRNMAMVIIVVMSLMGNLMMIIIKVRSPSDLLGSKITTIFLMNVVISDFAVGLLLTPFNGFYAFAPEYHMKLWFCLVLYILNYVTVSASSFSLLWVTVDRYMSIIHPFLHQRVWTYRIACVLVAASWTIPLVSSLPVIGWNDWDPTVGCYVMQMLPVPHLMMTFVFDVSASLVMLTLNLKVYIVARNQARSIAERMKAVGGLAAPDRQLMENKAGRLIGLVVTVYVLFSTPTMVYYAVSLIYRLNEWDSSALAISFIWILAVRIFNSCMNPLIFYRTMPGVKAAAKRSFLACK